MPIALTPDFWDCECESNYIHRSVHPYCLKCDTFRVEQPDSRQEEVCDMNRSRPKRWNDAIQYAEAGLNALVEIQEEYNDWYENLPENLQQSPVGEKLEEVANVDIEGALATLEEASEVELPLGFGRD
jgi:hypothetical protein